MFSPHPARGDGAVATPAPALGSFRRDPGASFSAGDVGLNGEPSGLDPAVPIPLGTAGSTNGLSADGHAHIPVVLWEQPSALGFSPGWWIDAPSQLLVLLAVASVAGLGFVTAIVRELRDSDADGEVEAIPPVSDSPPVAESERDELPAHELRDGQHLAVVAGPSAIPTPT